MKIFMIFATALSLSFLSTGKVNAQAVQSQNLSTESRVNCNTGSYGQNVNCTAESNARGSQYQRIVYRNGVAVHEPVNTALDAQSTAVAVTAMLSGVAGVIIKLKNRA